jgi:hypothetical protein
MWRFRATLRGTTARTGMCLQGRDGAMLSPYRSVQCDVANAKRATPHRTSEAASQGFGPGLLLPLSTIFQLPKAVQFRKEDDQRFVA